MIAILVALGIMSIRDGPRGIDRVPKFPYENLLNDQPSYRHDPLLLIQVANELIPLGRERALAELTKLATRSDDSVDDLLMHSLVRTIFVPKKAGYVFPDIGGAISPDRPKDPKSWPTFPLRMIDDMPLSFLQARHVVGMAMPFRYVIEQEQSNWEIRTHVLSPPDNPYAALENFKGLDEGERRHLEEEISNLVRNAYVPKDRVGFEKLRSRWDPWQMRYVRHDGTSDDDIFADVTEHQINFPPRDHMAFSLTYQRDGHAQVGYKLSGRINRPSPLPNVKLSVYDGTTKVVLNRLILSSRTMELVKHNLGRDPKSSVDWSDSRGEERFSAHVGQSVIFELSIDGYKIRKTIDRL